MQTCLTHASATPQKGDHPTGCPGHSSNAHMQGRQACKCKCSTKARRETRRGRNRQAEASSMHTGHTLQATHRNEQAKNKHACLTHASATPQKGGHPTGCPSHNSRAHRQGRQACYASALLRQDNETHSPQTKRHHTESVQAIMRCGAHPCPRRTKASGPAPSQDQSLTAAGAALKGQALLTAGEAQARGARLTGA
jgi:hypothetical protein